MCGIAHATVCKMLLSELLCLQRETSQSHKHSNTDTWSRFLIVGSGVLFGMMTSHTLALSWRWRNIMSKSSACTGPAGRRRKLVRGQSDRVLNARASCCEQQIHPGRWEGLGIPERRAGTCLKFFTSLWENKSRFKLFLLLMFYNVNLHWQVVLILALKCFQLLNAVTELQDIFIW